MKFKNHIFKFAIYPICAVTLISYNTPKDSYNNSVLWKINKPGDNSISYILGTMHVLDTTQINFPIEKIKSLIDKCENLCLELIPEQTNGMDKISEYLYLSDENLKISKHLEKDYYDELMQIVDSSKYTLKVFKPYLDSIRPTILSLYIEAEKQFSKTDKINTFNYFPETDLKNHASKKGIEITPLETVQQQINWIVKPELSFKKSLEILKKSIDNFKIKDSETDTFTNYLEQNLVWSPEVFSDSIMIVRNICMAEKIDSIINIKSSFIAIGAAHLPYENGVLNLLAQKGYTIKSHKIDMKKKN
jgi:uncharacterized protein YbaP (TraB family)